jgi:hypothetical protein
MTTSLGITPLGVIVTTLVAAGGGGVRGAFGGTGGTGAALGEGAEGAFVDPQAAAPEIAIATTTHETTFARGNRPAADRADWSTPAITFDRGLRMSRIRPTTNGIVWSRI